MSHSYSRSRCAAMVLLLLLVGLAAPARAQLPATAYIPIPGMPTEDVDMVELVPTPPGLPPTIVYPTETSVNYINMTTDVVYASVLKPGPNISGADFLQSPDGTVGVMPILGALCVFSQGPGPPALIMTVPLPGTPARRDIDPTIVPGLINPWDAIYATGTEIHRIDLTTGAIFWTTPLPTPVVEAVDPLYVAATGFGFPVVFAATDGNMTEINALTGAILPGTPITFPNTLIREVDIRLNPAGTLVFMHANFLLAAFSTATGAMVVSAPLPSMGIEGNDIEWDNTGTRGAAITVANMVWFNAGTGAITTSIPFVSPGPGIAYGHQRNQDLIFTAPGAGPQMAGYLAQGAFFLYTVPALPAAVTLLAATPTPSTTMDGVDPLTTDAPPTGAVFPAGPAGVVALVPTQGYISELDLRTGAIFTLPPMSPGLLRMDVDVRRGGTPPNKDYQPYIGGVAVMSGFGAGQFTVTVSTGVQVINVPAGTFAGPAIPTGMIFRGGDEQVTTLLGPAAPPYTTDDPDQDFVTKCWEYKYTLNRWPMWYAISNPLWYPQFLPYGVFGPPALQGWDIWNDWKVMVLRSQRVVLLNRQGALKQTIVLPAPPIGGLIWDWDNKICKLRLMGRQELIIDLKSVYWPGNQATFSFVPYQDGATQFLTEWYPIIDRMNGWEFVVERGCRRIWVYDHVRNPGIAVTFIDLPSRIIRPPIFDDQRKTLCCALADRRIFFFNSHIYRNTLSLAAASQYTVPLVAHCTADPVFDIYNHYTVCRLYGAQLAVIDNATANVVYNSGVLFPFPIGPIQIDCYNKIAKWYSYDGAQYWEHWMDLYPLAKIPASPPTFRTIAVGPVRPFGYPQFDSRDGWEYIRIGNTIRLDYLFNPYPIITYAAGIPLTGNLFLDRINKYGLCASTTNAVLWINNFRLEHSLPGATVNISLPAPATQGIHFLTQLHLAAVQLTSGQIAVIDMRAGTYLGTVPGAPPCQRQIYVQPFTGICNYPYWDGAQGYDVTVDLNPLRKSAPTAPTVFVQALGAGNTSNEAANFVGPPAIPAAAVAQMPFQQGDDNVPNLHHFHIMAGAMPPGLNYQVDDPANRDTPLQMDPVSGTLEEDGSGEFTAMAMPGDNLEIRFFDPEGNSSGTTLIPVNATTGVGGKGAPGHTSFALASSNPVVNGAQFHFALASRGRVELGIYDMSGRRVASLVSEVRGPGEYSETWNLMTASGTPAKNGIYFAKFEAGDFKDSRRVIVLK